MEKIEKRSHQDLDVIGIGNAIVDVLIQVEESSLEELSFQKGCMTLVDETQAELLYKRFNPNVITSGGSAANTLACIAQLQGSCGFIGRVKNDELGEIFTKQIISAGAKFETPASTTGPSTARCLILVTPDAQRTMCTYLGASIFLEPEDLDLQAIKQSKVLYLEGYLWDNPSAKNAFITAAQIAKENKKKVSLSLSDAFCVERHRESFLELIQNHIDILFTNEAEIKSLYRTSNLDNAIQKVKGICEITAITLGEKGSILLTKDQQIPIEPYSLGPLIDTTGAGDLYAGGFLKGFTEGLDLFKCGQIGSLCAGHIVTQLGPRTQKSLVELVKTHEKY